MAKLEWKDGDGAWPLTTARLRAIWKKIEADPDARKALDRIDKAGFSISHLEPNDASFKQPTWADYVAAIPVVPNKPSTRRIHRKSSLKKYWPLVRHLRRFAENLNSPFVEMRSFGLRDHPIQSVDSLRQNFLNAASTVEHFLSCDHYVRRRNPQNTLIASLRWEIRYRTGRPHDRELGVLINAAYRAAGYKQGCYIDSTTLDRIEKRDKESRVKATRRTRYRNIAPRPSPRGSTRNRRKPEKGV
jgi:hypothetical protein